MIEVTQKRNKNGGGEREKSNETSFEKTQKHEKFYCCGSGMRMLNNCKIIYTIAIYQWFDRTGNVHIHNQQAEERGDEKQRKVTQL